MPSDNVLFDDEESVFDKSHTLNISMKKKEAISRIWIIPIRSMHIKAELKLFESQIKTRWLRKKLSSRKLYFLYNKTI